MDRGKGILLFQGRKLGFAFWWVVLSAVTPGLSEAASLKLNPQLYLSYHYNSNIYAVDVLKEDPTVGQYLNALVGLESTYKTSHVELGTKGSIGATYYLDMNNNGDIAKQEDLREDMTYLRAAAGVFATFTGRLVSVDITDDIIRTRALSDLYGPQTEVISEVYLYTDNIAAIQFRIHPSPKTRVLLKYSFEYLYFTKADNNDIFTVTRDTSLDVDILLPPDSYEHHGYFRAEYDLDSHNTIFTDLQGGERIFLRREVNDVDVPFLDYNFLQGLLGYQYRFNERADFEISAGGHIREYFYGEYDYPPSFFGGKDGLASGKANIMYPQTASPIGRAQFTYDIPKQVKFILQGEYASSTYGTSLFYDYVNARLKLMYFFTRKTYMDLTGSYNYDAFERERNENYLGVWRHDRYDHIFVGQAGLYWDAILKNDDAWLKFGAGYMHQRRDSNLDQEKDYWNPLLFRSLDTDVDQVFVEVSFLPMILIGP